MKCCGRVFVTIDGEPWQKMLDDGEVKLEITDLGSLNEAERETAVSEAANSEHREPFDLAKGPIAAREGVAIE